MSQRIKNAFSQSVTKIFIAGVITYVLEGKHSNGLIHIAGLLSPIVMPCLRQEKHVTQDC